MGNPHGGDAWQFAGKSNRTSSRKIYSACRHCLLSISGVALLRKTGERSRLPYVTDLKKELRSRIVLDQYLCMITYYIWIVNLFLLLLLNQLYNIQLNARAHGRGQGCALDVCALQSSRLSLVDCIHKRLEVVR